MEYAALLARAQAALFGSETALEFERAAAFAVLLIFIDYLIFKGPLRHIVLRIFPVETKGDAKKEEQKLCGQVAARFVGCIFLIFMFPFAFQVLADPELRRDKLYASNAHSTACIVYAAGYFLYDIYICTARFGENGHQFLLHAVLCCAAYGYPILTGHLHYVGACFLMWELSTPFLYLRWVLLKTNRGDGPLMKPANVAFVLVFFACRVVYGPYMSWDFWATTAQELAAPRHGGIPVGVIYSYRTAMFILNGLNYFWFSQMMKIVLGFGGKKAHKKVE